MMIDARLDGWSGGVWGQKGFLSFRHVYDRPHSKLHITMRASCNACVFTKLCRKWRRTVVMHHLKGWSSMRFWGCGSTREPVPIPLVSLWYECDTPGVWMWYDIGRGWSAAVWINLSVQLHLVQPRSITSTTKCDESLFVNLWFCTNLYYPVTYFCFYPKVDRATE